MLRIYEKDLTAASLSTALATNGLGALPHTLSCTRHQVINGDWSLTLSYPLDAPGRRCCSPNGSYAMRTRAARSCTASAA